MNRLDEIVAILLEEISADCSKEQLRADVLELVNNYENPSELISEYEAIEYLEASDLLVSAASSLLEGNKVEAFRLFVQAVNDPSSDVVFNALSNWNREAINNIVAKALEQADPVEFDDALEHNWQSDVDDEESGNGDGNDYDPETHYPSWITADDEEPEPGDMGLADFNNEENDPDSNFNKDDFADDDSSADQGLDAGPEETGEGTALASEIKKLIKRNKATLHGV